MTRRIACSLALALLAASMSTASAGESRLIDFRFQDQFGHVHQSADVQGKIVLLIGGDGSGGPASRAWDDAIEAALGSHPGYGRIARLNYADLRSVPFFLEGWARDRFPDNPEEWAMMDWHGRLAKAYDFVSGAANMAVFAPDGRLVLQTSGHDLDEAKLDELVAALRGLLDADEKAPGG